jgi:hypothetical protein
MLDLVVCKHPFDDCKPPNGHGRPADGAGKLTDGAGKLTDGVVPPSPQGSGHVTVSKSRA